MKEKYKIIVLNNHMPFSNYNETTKKYEGFFVEIWEMITEDLKLQYEYFKSNENDEMDNIIQKIYNNVYDIGIGKFSITKNNINLVNFARPIKITSYYIFKLNNNSFVNNFFSNTFYYIILIVFIVYMIILLIYWSISKISFFSAFYQTFLLFTNQGINNSKYQNYLTIKILNMFIILFSLLFFNFIIYNIVHSITNKEYYISESELKSIKTLYEIRYSASAYFAEELKYKTIMIKNFNDLELKMKNNNYYSLLDIEYINYNLKKNKYLTSLNPLIKDENSFPINKKHIDLLQNIDKTIVKLQDENKIINICKKFNFDIYSCYL
jgi:ABC-type amino acid transport substrate-binding protein